MALRGRIDRAVEVMRGNVPTPPESGKVIAAHEPPKDEPELVICQNIEKTPDFEGCHHAKPHQFGKECEFVGVTCGPCISYKKEQTVPEMQQPIDIQQAHTAQIEACHDRLDKHDADIGALTLRLDNLEREVKDQREDYHAHIRQFVEENTAAHKSMETALKSLKEEVAAIPRVTKQPVSDPCTLCKLDAPFCTTCVHHHYKRLP